jgi:hypothetical protein
MFKSKNRCPVGISLYGKKAKKTGRGPARLEVRISSAAPRGTLSWAGLVPRR